MEERAPRLVRAVAPELTLELRREARQVAPPALGLAALEERPRAGEREEVSEREPLAPVRREARIERRELVRERRQHAPVARGRGRERARRGEALEPGEDAPARGPRLPARAPRVRGDPVEHGEQALVRAERVGAEPDRGVELILREPARAGVVPGEAAALRRGSGRVARNARGAARRR